MPSTTSAFAPEQYRGFLLLLARGQWDGVLKDWGDPSDLVHQTLLEAHQQRGAFKEETAAAFVAWLRTILERNLHDAIRYCRRKKRDYRRTTPLRLDLDESSTRLGFGLAQDDPSPSALAATAERLNLLADALDQLPADQAEAVTLHHVKGLTLAEAAAQMGRTKPAVAGLLRRGLERLREVMGDGGSNER